MSARRMAIVAAFVGGIGWLAKMVVMAAQGGPDLDSVAETIAFLTGLVGVLAASAAAAVHLTRDRSRWFRAGSAVVTVVALVLITGLLQTVLTALPGDSWMQEEAAFGLVGLAAVVMAVVWARRDEGASAAV